MESANSHHHLQDQLVGSSASSLPNYGVGFTTTHAWPPSSFLNFNCLSSNSSERKQQENPSMAPDMGFNNWGSEQEVQHECRIKEELADHYYHKYSEILSSSSDELNLRNEQQGSDLQPNDVATKFLLKSLSSYGKINNAPDFYSNNNNTNTRQIFPEYSSFNIPPPGSLDMNLEALDLLVSSRFTGNFLASSHGQIGILRDEFSTYGLDQMHQSHQIPFYGSNKVSSASSNAVTEAKRKSNKMEPKSQIQKAPKKSRLEARSSCPPFKVRKEKLGDRIAALQQLVAPFGKTDTASVLMEAIGYIKFLQTQVETLSVPYMKASRNKTNRVTKGGPVEIENEEAKGDLKSRGLCLVPLSCLSYITDGGGPAVWPPPHFGGAT
ncbi:transcription factor bHLH110 [Salvia miltiorrhiza]|uniref:transcription factor bHLH110 n=1 Tax=Salvia miltiorrhiza TaxID=226208 RepID=UPI0025AB985E|nr:transcription factor bHLH110 [Salvia miltiorrhiza]